MATYKRPGVFVEENLRPLTQALSAPGDAAYAAFVGTHPKGPVAPTLINSWTQFQSIYGTFSPNPAEYLGHAVYQFFNNGGRHAWIVRAVNTNAVAASVSLLDVAGTPSALLTVTAKNVGVAGNNLYVSIEKTDPDATGTADTRFNLFVHEGGSTSGFVVERFTDLTMDPASERYAIPFINSVVIGSSRIRVAHAGTTTYTLLRARPATQAGTVLSSGSDGTGTPALDTAAKTLENLEGTPNLLLNLPGVIDTTILNSVIIWGSGLGTVFTVVDAPAFATSDAATVTSYSGIPTSLGKNSYAAIYGPWILVDDPASSVRGAVRPLPPGGAVIGQYQATDARRGVQKPAAGIENAISGVLGLDTKLLAADLDTLNQKGFNVIKPIPGVGYCIFGARTLSSSSADRYVSVRRVLMAIKKDLLEGTRFAVFEPNDSFLWARLTGVIEDYLTAAQQVRLIRGQSPAQGFYVRVDETNNTEASIAAGEVNIEVGVALLQPAEFVIIKIGQYSGTAVATEIV